MMDKFIKALKRNAQVSAWSITEVTKRSRELFYVLDKLETNRATETTDYNVTIYVDKNKKRGIANFAVYDYMSDKELDEKIAEKVYAASFAMNKFFEIPGKDDRKLKTRKTNLKDRPFAEIMEDLVKAVFAANVHKNGYLSATEFFITEWNERIVNSNGVDLSSKKYGAQVEIIPSWEKNGEEVEVYHMLNLGSFNAEEVTAEVDEQLMEAKARFDAVSVPKNKKLKVIIQDGEVGELLYYFVSELSYRKAFMKINKFKPGDHVQGKKVTGDLLNIKLSPFYEGAYNSRAFDSDGVVLDETEIIKDGVAVNRHGSYRFGYYLKEKAPTGVLPVTVVKEGKKTFKEMQKEPYVRCVKFSGLQVDASSGYFGGEVRLGFYFDGKKEVPVTGFSVSGDMNKSASGLVFSKETVTKPSYHGPKYVEIKDMTVM